MPLSGVRKDAGDPGFERGFSAPPVLSGMPPSALGAASGDGSAAARCLEPAFLRSSESRAGTIPSILSPTDRGGSAYDEWVGEGQGRWVLPWFPCHNLFPPRTRSIPAFWRRSPLHPRLRRPRRPYASIPGTIPPAPLPPAVRVVPVFSVSTVISAASLGWNMLWAALVASAHFFVVSLSLPEVRGDVCPDCSAGCRLKKKISRLLNTGSSKARTHFVTKPLQRIFWDQVSLVTDP